MRIQHNLSALNSHRQLGINNNAVAKNLEKLSSGYRINRAGDDAAGLAISEKMRAQIKGLQVAQNNTNDGISLIQTAEGALGEIHSMLNRMVELATQSANGTYDDKVDRDNLNQEITSLKSEIDRISQTTNFNGIKLLDGGLGGRSSSIQSNALAGITIKGGDGTGITAAAFNLQIESDGGVTLTTGTGAVIQGVSWLVIGNTDIAVAAGLPAYTRSTANGSVTYRGIVDRERANALSPEIEKYNGMEITIFLNDNLTTEFNASFADPALVGVTGAYGVGAQLQIGDSSEAVQQVNVSIAAMTTKGLNMTKVNVANQDLARTSIDIIKNAINTVSTQRADLGTIQNRLEHTIANLGTTEENMTASESRIRDVDMAKEMMMMTKNNILAQASQAMLAQANTLPQGVLQLLK